MSTQKDYVLEDVIELNKEYPRTFTIPSKEEIDNLATGMLVKLIFLLDTPQDGCDAERMWVEITDKEDDTFYGILTNVPHYIKSIQAGDIILFERKHIATIYAKGKALFDTKKFAIITKRALKKRQINWAIHTDDLVDEKDSGWQFFYGDEDDEYLDDYQNGAIVSLENVLNFEPLLEKILSENGYSYEYCEETNEFVQVQ